MIFARMTTARFKAGKRENAMEAIDDFKEEAQELNGFKGITAFLSMDDPDVATLITLWDSEESLNASRGGIFQRMMKEIDDMMDGPPEVKNQKVRELRSPTSKVPA